MADVAVDSQSGDVKAKEQDAVLLQTDLSKEKKGKVQGEQTIIEPIMVKDAFGKKCLYYFEEGSHHLLEVIEGDTNAFLPEKIQEAEVIFKRIWREVFSILRIFTSFVVLFVVELIFYLIHYLFQPLVLNSLSVIGNHLLKPLLITVFNNFIQPSFAFVWNILNAVVTAVNPAVELLAQIVKQGAILLQSTRLFNVNYYSGSTQRKLETV